MTYEIFNDKLEKISVAKLKTINSEAFDNCSSLSKLTLGIIPPILDETDPFKGLSSTRYLELVDEKGNRIIRDKLITAEKAYVKADIRWYDGTFISDLVTAVKLDKTNKQHLKIQLMFSLSDSQNFWLYTKPTDIRKSFFTLSGLVCYEMKIDTLCGDVFVFINERRNRIKLLHMEPGGLVLYSKLL